MVAISTAKTKEHPVVHEVYEAHAKNRKSSHRWYLGMSEIGGSCERAIWYSWRKFTPAPQDGRMMILFELGDHVEQIVTRSLRLAGYQLEGAYPDQQFSFDDLGGFWRGHSDGIITLPEQRAVLECKSANKNKFEEMKKDGVRKAQPKYYVQAQCYMVYSGISKCLFVVMNKNTSELYIEEIDIDTATFYATKAKAERIIKARTAPERGFDDKACVDCSWCDYRTHCWSPEDAIQERRACISCADLCISDGFIPSCCNAAHAFTLKDIFVSCPDWRFAGRAEQ
jgi:hypothetical protein